MVVVKVTIDMGLLRWIGVRKPCALPEDHRLTQEQPLSIYSPSCEPRLLCQGHVLGHGHLPVTDGFCWPHLPQAILGLGPVRNSFYLDKCFVFSSSSVIWSHVVKSWPGNFEVNLFIFLLCDTIILIYLDLSGSSPLFKLKWGWQWKGVSQYCDISASQILFLTNHSKILFKKKILIQ